MAQVLIRGRISTVELSAGEETIVEDTERVQELARFGYIRIVGSIAGTHTPQPVSGLLVIPEDMSVPAEDAADLEDLVDAATTASLDVDADAEPPRSGAGSGKPTWQRFLIAQGVDYPEDASRDDLIAIWDSREE